MSKYRIEQELLHKKKLGRHTLEHRIIGKGQITISYTTDTFHYTSPEGLIGILKNREIFFTDAQFLNDSNERFDINMELKQFWDNNSTKYDKEFYHLLRDIKVDSYEDETYAYIDGENTEEVYRYFILSASMNKDSLNLWKYYAKNGTYNGYNIGLFIPALCDEWLDRDTGVAIEEGLVIYDSIEKQDKIYKMVEELYELWCVYKRSSEMDQKIQKEYKTWVSYASLFFKKKCFRDEEEMRFVAVIPKYKINELMYEKTDGAKVKMYDFRNVNGVITPYIKMPLFGWDIEDNWITSHIGVGPCLDFAQKKYGLLRFINSLDYKFNQVNIRESEVPVRY